MVRWQRERGRDLVYDWLPSLVLSVAAYHEQSYNHSSPIVWVEAQALVWLLVLRRRAPEPVFAVTLLVGLVGWATHQLLFAHLGILVALNAIALSRSRGKALVAAAIVEVGALMVSWRFAPTGSVNDAAVLLTGLTMSALLLGTTQRTQRLYLRSVEERAAQLELERNQRAIIAAAQERARLAREMHDIVAHSVAVMIALSDGAVAGASRDPEASVGSMREVARTGRRAMGELRRVLSVLRGPAADDRMPAPTLDGLPDLVAEFRSAGLDTTLDVSGPVDRLPEGLQANVFRIVQEGLTNVLKHAERPTRTQVEVAALEGSITVRVRDDGREPLDIPPGHEEGSGLRGMAERAELYGGRVEAGHDGSGWLVTCTLLCEEGADDDLDPARR